MQSFDKFYNKKDNKMSSIDAKTIMSDHNVRRQIGASWSITVSTTASDVNQWPFDDKEVPSTRLVDAFPYYSQDFDINRIDSSIVALAGHNCPAILSGIDHEYKIPNIIQSGQCLMKIRYKMYNCARIFIEPRFSYDLKHIFIIRFQSTLERRPLNKMLFFSHRSAPIHPACQQLNIARVGLPQQMRYAWQQMRLRMHLQMQMPGSECGIFF